jgi:hypothetical protein
MVSRPLSRLGTLLSLLALGVFAGSASAAPSAKSQKGGAQKVAPKLSKKPLRAYMNRQAGQPAESSEKLHTIPNQDKIHHGRKTNFPGPQDPVVQWKPGLTLPPDPAGVSVEGFPMNGSAPSDANGAVGPDFYVQWVNSVISVFLKDGTYLGSIPGNALWSGFGGPCETHNDGDPIAQYDILADRWVLSQFVAFAPDGSHQCFAVSQTGDLLGNYYLYDFHTGGPDLFEDYPHIGVWPDAYYMTTHEFYPYPFYDGQGLFAFDRQSMLQGLPATFQAKTGVTNLSHAADNPYLGGALPADLDGLTPPPDGAPELIFAPGSWELDGTPNPVLHVWKASTTWGGTPTFTVTQLDDLPVAPFDAEVCRYFTRNCVPQPKPAKLHLDKLDAISDRLMWRVAYRNFGDHQSIVLNHTVKVLAPSVTKPGIRWYELRLDNNSNPSVFQQGTYAPDNPGIWMGSLAMDNEGNMALGYSKSDFFTFPEIDLAGRKAGDDPGILGAEELMKAGAGSQLDTDHRWGDYSAMRVDPRDGCTFWYTTQYQPASGSFTWDSWIANFKYSTCEPPAQGTIEGTVTDCNDDIPLSGALVTAGDFSGATDDTGHYSITLPPGNYDVVATAEGRLCNPSSSAPVVVNDGQTSTQDFCLTGDPLLAFQSDSFDDSSGSGNNDNGIVNLNEGDIHLDVTLVNNGCDESAADTGTLTTDTTGVVIDTDTANYAAALIDGTVTNATDFVFHTTCDLVCGAPIHFTLTLNSIDYDFYVPTCEAAPTTVTGASIDSGDSTQNSRMGRDGNPSTCASAKSCPQPLGTGPRLYDEYDYTNDSDVDRCITINAVPHCPGEGQLMSVAYLGSFNPSDICENYLGDSGTFPDPSPYEVVVPAHSDLVVIVNTSNQGATCSDYDLTVSGFVDSTPANACP